MDGRLAEDEGVFSPRSIALSDEATSEFEQFRRFVHVGKDGLDGREREWWAKMPAHTLRLAGTLCFLNWAMFGGPEPTQVEATAKRAAIRLVRDYFWPHSRAALRQIGLTERHANSRRALRWIKANQKTEVSVKDIRREAFGGSLDQEGTETLLGALVSAGWLQKRTTPPGKRGGKPLHRWDVNPMLRRGAETAETAETKGAGS